MKNISRIFINHPLKLCLGTYLAVSLVLVSLISIDFQTNIELLLAKRVGEGVKNQQEYDRLWNKNFVAIVVVRTLNGSNIINRENLLLIYDLYDSILNSSVVYENKVYKYRDICTKMYDPGNGFLCYYKSPTTMFSSRQEIESLTNDRKLFLGLSKLKSGWCGQIIDIKDTVGKAEFDPATTLMESGQALKLQVFFEANGDEAFALQYLFDEAIENIVEGFKKSVNDENLEFLVITESVYARELLRDILPSIVSFVVGIVVIWIFTCFVLSAKTRKSKIILASQALFNTTLALAAGIGVSSAFGLSINPISLQILPFFMFGIGLDNCLFLASLFVSSEAEARVEVTLRDGVTAMLISTFEMSIIFLIMLALNLNLIISLSWMTCASLLFNVVIQSLTFVPMMIILDKNSPDVYHDKLRQYQISFLTNHVYKNLKSGKYQRTTYVCLFIALTIICAPMLMYVRKDIIFNSVLPTKSILLEFPIIYQEYFSNITFPVFLTFNEDLTVLETRKEIVEIDREVGNLPIIVQIQSLIKDFGVWSSFRRGIDITSPGNYDINLLLSEFLNNTADGSICYRANHIDLGGNKSEIRLMYYVKKPDSMISLYENFQSIATVLKRFRLDTALTGTMHAAAMVFESMYYDYMVAISSICGGFFIMHYVFYRSIVLSLISTAMMIMLQVQVLGLYGLFGINLNPVTLMNCLITTGIFVDYSGYFTQLFITRGGQDPKVYAETGASVSNGFISTFISLMFLAFGKFPFVQLYFMYPYLLILTVVWFACLFVYPACLISLAKRTNLMGKRLDNNVDENITNSRDLEK